MLKSAAPAFFIRIDLMDDFPRLVVTQKMTRRHGVMHLGPFIGKRSIERSVRTLARLLSLRTCAGRLRPDADFSPCIYGQMGHCSAPCNLSIDASAYDDRVRDAVGFLRGSRTGSILGGVAKARDQAASAMRFEEANRYHRDLESLATLSSRVSRLSQVVTENNLVIVTGAGDDRAAHVVLSGRLAMTRQLDSPEAALEVARHIADNFERYRAVPIARHELEPMMIVARWLRECRDEGRVINLTGSQFDPNILAPTASSGNQII
jgi:excinuclease ABC subunit C